MKTIHFTVTATNQQAAVKKAWEKVNEIFPSDYIKDESASKRAGYNIFRSTTEYYNYICDLENRFEINLITGETIIIWIKIDETIEIEPKTISEYEIVSAAYYYILDKWAKENDRKKALNEAGKNAPIAEYRMNKYQNQLDELHEIIIKFENATNN